MVGLACVSGAWPLVQGIFSAAQDGDGAAEGDPPMTLGAEGPSTRLVSRPAPDTSAAASTLPLVFVHSCRDDKASIMFPFFPFSSSPFRYFTFVSTLRAKMPFANTTIALIRLSVFT